nr:hypothetical protein [Tanacetum cinerariifolium]
MGKGNSAFVITIHWSFIESKAIVGDGASWSTVVMKGEPVDAAGSEATTLAFRAMTLEAITVSSSKYTLMVLMIRLSTVKTLQAHALKQDEELATLAKSSTNMAWNPAPLDSVTLTLALTHIPTNVEGENKPNTATEDLSSLTEGEPDANKQEKPKKPKNSTDANIEFIGSSTPKPSVIQE